MPTLSGTICSKLNQSVNHHLLGADSKHHFSRHLISFCNFSSGRSSLVAQVLTRWLCFQMLCDKSSKTLKCHHSALKKEVIRCANSQVSLRQLYNNISGPRQPGRTLSPWRRNTGFLPPAPQSQVHLKLLWKLQY